MHELYIVVKVCVKDTSSIFFSFCFVFLLCDLLNNAGIINYSHAIVIWTLIPMVDLLMNYMSICCLFTYKLSKRAINQIKLKKAMLINYYDIR